MNEQTLDIDYDVAHMFVHCLDRARVLLIDHDNDRAAARVRFMRVNLIAEAGQIYFDEVLTMQIEKETLNKMVEYLDATLDEIENDELEQAAERIVAVHDKLMDIMSGQNLIELT